jgi:hypothetical protein
MFHHVDVHRGYGVSRRKALWVFVTLNVEHGSGNLLSAGVAV